MSRKPAPRRKRPNGTGSIRLIGKDSYELRYPAHLGGGTDRVDGTHAQAEAKLNKWIATRDVRFVEMGPVPTLAEWAQKYLDVYSRNQHSPTEQASARRIVTANIIDDPVGRTPINLVDRGVIEDWLNGLADPDRVKGKPLKPASLKRYRAAMSGVMQFAVDRRKDVEDNPVRRAVRPSADRLSAPREIRFFDESDVNRFVAQCQAELHRWGALFLTSALLGLRPGEAVGLHWHNVHLDAPVPYARIERALVRPDTHKVHSVGPTKRRDERNVELHPFVVDALRELRAHQDSLGVVACAPEWDDLVFLRWDKWSYGGPMSNKYVEENLTALCKRAGLSMTPNPTPYSLRHTCASILIDAEESLTKIAWMLGTSEDMLRMHYGHKIDGDIHTVGTAAMTAMLGGGRVIPMKRKRAG